MKSFRKILAILLSAWLAIQPMLACAVAAATTGTGGFYAADSAQRNVTTTTSTSTATNSAHDLPVAPNLLKRDFSTHQPNAVWVTDITYLWTGEGWLYLAMILDLYSRKIVGWSMSDRMTSTLVCDALRMAWFRRGRPSGVLVHSDRGSQYCGRDFQRLLKKFGMRSSMSRKGDCRDNAVAESFFHSLKVEEIHGEVFATRAAMREAVFEYIENYYNRERKHSTIGYQTPEQFEQRKAA